MHLCTVFVTHVLRPPYSVLRTPYSVLRTPRLRGSLDHPHFLRHAIDLMLYQGELGVQGGDFVPEQGVFFPEGFEFFEDFSDEMMNVHSYLKGWVSCEGSPRPLHEAAGGENPRA